MTLTRPKHLLPIANRPHIRHVFDLLTRHGVTDVVLTTSYLAEEFGSTIAEARAEGITLEVAHEPEPRGTGGAIKNAQPKIGDERFLVLNADVLTAADITALVSFHESTAAEATILLTAVDDPSAFGVVPTEAGGRVTGFIEKPSRGEAPTNLINAGVYVMEPRVFDRIPPGVEWSAERSLFPEIVAAGTLYAFPSDAYWMDIGTPAKYLQANIDALEGRFETDAVSNPRPGGLLVEATARLAVGAEVSSSCIGADCVVESATKILRSVLLPGARVGAGAVVRDSVIGERAVVAPGAELNDLATGDGDVVGGNEEE